MEAKALFDLKSLKAVVIEPINEQPGYSRLVFVLDSTVTTLESYKNKRAQEIVEAIRAKKKTIWTRNSWIRIPKE